MMAGVMSDVTRILSAIEHGEPQAAEKLLPLVYDELRRLAVAQMAQEKPGQTLQATALVHEAYLRLVGKDQAATFANRRHFVAAAAEAMRRILVDAARHKQSLKAGVGLRRVDLDDVAGTMGHAPDELLALDDALAKLHDANPAAAELAKLRLFAGLSVDQAADNLGVSRRTGFRHWTYARSFLQVEMTGGDAARSS
jgi:RNA polymerase sigma factor (TIGR02999 family)